MSARRETVFGRSAGGMLNVAGGKLTTYRRIALESLDRLRIELGLHRLDSRPWALPGVVGFHFVSLPSSSTRTFGAHLVHLYGSRAPDVVAPAVGDPSLLERIDPACLDIAAQVRYAATHEWAHSADDILHRRTTCFVRGLDDDATRTRVERLLAGRLAA